MTATRFPWHYVLAMAIIVAASNYLVSIPINEWLVWGSLTYPVAFLVTVALSLYLADPRIAFASGTAFLLSQLLDVSVFNKLRQHIWWVAPIVSSALSSFVDNTLFWVLAFFGDGDWWYKPMVTDLLVKWGVALAALIPYGVILKTVKPGKDVSSQDAVS